MTSPDEGLTTSAWCEAQAGRWMRPTYLAAVALLAAAAGLSTTQLAVHLIKRRRSPV